jgi:arabinose-5-phosphate isomerase
MLQKPDIIIAISNSGTTKEVVETAKRASEIGSKVIAITGGADSPLAKTAEIILSISISSEADHLNLAPTSSSTVTLALGDALAVAVSRAKGFTADQFGFLHAGGALGKKAKSTSQNKA